MSHTFELGPKSSGSRKKFKWLNQLPCGSILVPTAFDSVAEIASSYDDKALWMEDNKTFNSGVTVTKAVKN